MSFEPYLKAPNSQDKCWIHYTEGGYNYCIKVSGRSCIPNCVGYVWGEWRKRLGQSPRLSKGNANTFWGFKDGYGRTQFPRLGSIICWDDGKYGHVGCVEKYDQKTGTITVAQSAYNGTRFYLTEVKPPYDYGRFKLQGFIHLPNSKPLPKAGTPMETKITHVPSMYTFKEKGDSVQLKTQVNDGKKPTYKSSNTKVATVTAGGLVKAVGAGTALITVKAGKAERTIPVTVPSLKSWNEIIKPVYDAVVAQAKWEKDAKYAWKGASRQTIAESKKNATCVTFVNCVLYRLGILKEKSYIYQDTKGNVRYFGASSALKKSAQQNAKNYLVVSRVKNVRPAKLKKQLRRGDILMYTRGTVKAGAGSHICIYTGKFKGDDAVVWDNNWASKGMKTEKTFNQPLDSYIRFRWFKVRTQCENGTITLSNNYLAKETVTVRYSGKNEIRSITVDGKNVDPKKYPSSYTFKDLCADHTIRVVYK